MKLLRAVIAVMLVAVWLPASSHSFLQHIGAIHQVHSHNDSAQHCHAADDSHPHEHNADNHAAADGHCLAPGGKTKAPFPPSAAAPVQTDVSTATHPAQDALAVPRSGLSPPEITSRWQFSLRAALPARAPSSVA